MEGRKGLVGKDPDEALIKENENRKSSIDFYLVPWPEIKIWKPSLVLEPDNLFEPPPYKIPEAVFHGTVKCSDILPSFCHYWTGDLDNLKFYY